MQSLLAKIAALALLGAGFAATGDLRRLTERGARFLNTTTVPAGRAEAAAGGSIPDPPGPRPPVAPPPAPAQNAAPETASSPPADHRDAPLGSPVEVRRLPVSTLESIDIGKLAPGARLTLWVGPARTPVEFDVVDPGVGEVLEQVASPAGQQPRGIARRLRLEGTSGRPTQIDRGGMLRLTPLGVAYGGRPTGPAETLGPVRAIEVQERLAP